MTEGYIPPEENDQQKFRPVEDEDGGADESRVIPGRNTAEGEARTREALFSANERRATPPTPELFEQLRQNTKACELIDALCDPQITEDEVYARIEAWNDSQTAEGRGAVTQLDFDLARIMPGNLHVRVNVYDTGCITFSCGKNW